MSRVLLRRVRGLALPALLVVLWIVLTQGGGYLYFPPIGDIISSYRTWWDNGLGTDLASSLISLVVGYAVAVVAGITVGYLLGTFRLLRSAFAPYIHLVRSIPPITFVPICVLLLGLGASMRITVIAVGAAFPVILSTIDGVRGIPSEMEDMATAFRLSPSERLFQLTLRGASPSILAGMKTSLTIAIILIVTSEMQASTQGIGHFVIAASRTFSIADSWAGTILLGIIGYLASELFSVYQRRALFWVQGGSNHDR